MFTCVIFISGFSLNAGHQQLSTTDQIHRWFLTIGTYELVIFDGKNLMAPLAANCRGDGVDVQAGASRNGLLTDHFETKRQCIRYDGRQRPHLKANTDDPGKSMATPFIEHHIKHILGNRQFMHSRSL
jgi:hypothetical protein